MESKSRPVPKKKSRILPPPSSYCGHSDDEVGVIIINPLSDYIRTNKNQKMWKGGGKKKSNQMCIVTSNNGRNKADGGFSSIYVFHIELLWVYITITAISYEWESLFVPYIHIMPTWELEKRKKQSTRLPTVPLPAWDFSGVVFRPRYLSLPSIFYL